MRCLLIFILVISVDHGFSQPVTEAVDSNRTYLQQMQDFFDNNESLHIPGPVKRQHLYNELRSFIVKHSANEISFNAIFYWGLNLSYEQVDTLNNLIDHSIRSSPQRSWAEIVLKRISVAETGKPFPSLVLKDTSGNESDLSGLVGKTVLIDIWSSGCVPCREQIPALKKLYKKYNSKGFEMIGISVDQDRQNWLKAIQRDKQTWKQYCELVNWRMNKFAMRFSVWGIPANYLIDKNGILVGQDLSPEAIENWLAQHH